MRKSVLFTAVAGLALVSPAAKGDFVIGSTRQSNALVISSGPSAGAYDVVTYSIFNTRSNGTGNTIFSLDVALYAPVNYHFLSYPGNGLLVGVGTGDFSTSADVFRTNAANESTASWIADDTPPFRLLGTIGPRVLPLGADPATNAGVDPFSQVFTSQQKVSGIAGIIFDTPGGQDATSGVIFARAVVPHGSLVLLLNPNNGRTFEPNSGIFSNGNNSFEAANNNSSTGPYDGVVVPEPAGVVVVGIGMAGVASRRRKG